MFAGLGQSRALIFESSDRSGYEGIIITAPADFDTGPIASDLVAAFSPPFVRAASTHGTPIEEQLQRGFS
jgi:hypothetical protein